MQVGRWGNSLAVRLPAALVDALRLKEGDEIEIASDCLRALARPLPPGFRFSRDDANERDA